MKTAFCDWCGETAPVLTVTPFDEGDHPAKVCQRCLRMAHDAAAKGVDGWEAARGFVGGPRWSEMDGAITATIKYRGDSGQEGQR